jgi:hypothetical protein
MAAIQTSFVGMGFQSGAGLSVWRRTFSLAQDFQSGAGLSVWRRVHQANEILISAGMKRRLWAGFQCKQVTNFPY